MVKGGNRKIDKEAEPEPPTASSSPKVEAPEAQKAGPENITTGETERTDNPDFLNLEDFLQLDNLPLLTVSNVEKKCPLLSYLSTAESTLRKDLFFNSNS